jgi:hypothetical protein
MPFILHLFLLVLFGIPLLICLFYLIMGVVQWYRGYNEGRPWMQRSALWVIGLTGILLIAIFIIFKKLWAGY